MSRNKYPGDCYRCGEWVPAGEGHYERLAGHWRVQHATCAIEMRGVPDPTREAYMDRIRIARAAGTGRRAQRARKTLRDKGLLPPAENSAGVSRMTRQGNLPPAEPHDTSTKGGV